MAQERIQKQKAVSKQEEVVEDTSAAVTSEELQQAVDDTLEKIDDLLEDQLDLELLDFMDEVLGDEE